MPGLKCQSLALVFNLIASASASARPHVVFVLTDDYGWGNFGVHRQARDTEEQRQGQAEVQTPNLERLVNEGILINRHYAYKICSPSRSSLQSGRLAVHVNDMNAGVTVHNASDPVSGYAGIPRNMTGLAQKMLDAGYRTHMVGKWDVGMATPEHTPQGRGYESWVGYFQHANNYWTQGSGLQSTGEVDNCLNSLRDFFKQNSTYRGGVIDGVTNTEQCRSEPQKHASCYEEYTFNQRALEVIREHDLSKPDSPLFLFYAFHLLHTPLEVPSQYLRRIDAILKSAGLKSIDSQNRRQYAGMVLYMDEAVGNVVKALQARDMWENTLLIFAADNGGAVYEPGSGNNHPLKGGKYADWEGGVRTNSFIAGGFVPAKRRGTSFEGVVSIADWYGTLCEIAGTDSNDHKSEAANQWLAKQGLPLLKPVDSVAQWGFILNDTNGRSNALHLSELAVLKWPYKLVTGDQPYSFWQGEMYPNCSTIGRFQAGQGPAFADQKIFGKHILPGNTKEENDTMLWAQDCGAGCLVNVETDPTEHEDLAGKPDFAQKLAELQKELKQLNQNHFSPLRGKMQLEACNMAIDKGGFLGPFVDIDDYYSPVPPPSLKTRLKNAALKAQLKVVNTDVFEHAVQRTVQKNVASAMHFLTSKWDKCLKHDSLTTGSDSTLVI